MFWTYTILGIIFGILALVCGALATYEDRKNNSLVIPANNTYNINGDYINRDKKVIENFTEQSKQEKTSAQPITTKLTASKSNEQSNTVKEQTINKGIINEAPNYGTQTVNNYSNEREPRKLNSEDIATIKTIPKNYNVQFNYINSTEESTKYAEEVFLEIKKLAYNITEVNAIGMYIESGGKPHIKGERIYLTLYDNDKRAVVIIREQK